MADTARVLYVEDEEWSNAELIRFLRAHGLELQRVGTLQDAITAASAGTYDCVLLDVMLPPGMADADSSLAFSAGIEFLRRLRGGEIPGANPNIPVVVLTARADAAVAEEMAPYGIHRFFNKPESNKTVISAIGQALAEAKAGAKT